MRTFIDTTITGLVLAFAFVVQPLSAAAETEFDAALGHYYETRQLHAAATNDLEEAHVAHGDARLRYIAALDVECTGVECETAFMEVRQAWSAKRRAEAALNRAERAQITAAAAYDAASDMLYELYDAARVEARELQNTEAALRAALDQRDTMERALESALAERDRLAILFNMAAEQRREAVAERNALQSLAEDVISEHDLLAAQLVLTTEAAATLADLIVDHCNRNAGPQPHKICLNFQQLLEEAEAAPVCEDRLDGGVAACSGSGD